MMRSSRRTLMPFNGNFHQDHRITRGSLGWADFLICSMDLKSRTVSLEVSVPKWRTKVVAHYYELGVWWHSWKWMLHLFTAVASEIEYGWMNAWTNYFSTVLFLGVTCETQPNGNREPNRTSAGGRMPGFVKLTCDILDYRAPPPSASGQPSFLLSI